MFPVVNFLKCLITEVVLFSIVAFNTAAASRQVISAAHIGTSARTQRQQSLRTVQDDLKTRLHALVMKWIVADANGQ